MLTKSLVGLLFPDEPVWSGLARLRARYPHLTKAQINEVDKFAKLNYVTQFTFPRRLSIVARIFNYEHDLLSFAMKHTFFPWLKLKDSKSAVFSDSRQRICAREYRKLEVLLEPKLKVCLRCIVRDIDEFGVPYWHRLHQFKDTICPRHWCETLCTEINRPTEDDFHYTPLTWPITCSADPKFRLDSVFARHRSRVSGEREWIYATYPGEYPIHVINEDLMEDEPLCVDLQGIGSQPVERVFRRRLVHYDDFKSGSGTAIKSQKVLYFINNSLVIFLPNGDYLM